jgi:hypothetical protein
MGNTFITMSLFHRGAEAAGHDPGTLPVVVQVNGPVTDQPLDGRAPVTGSVEQVAGVLAELRTLDVDQVLRMVVDPEPDQRLDVLDRLLAEHGRAVTAGVRR